MAPLHHGHEFSLFFDSAQDIAVHDSAKTITIISPELIHRITSVLRLKTGESIIFFDKIQSLSLTITDIHKKTITCILNERLPIAIPCPSITLMLPLLERDALEEVIYMAVVYGVKTVQLLISEKSRKIYTQKDHQRLYRIAQAASEQSKQFYQPQIEQPVALQKAILSVETAYKNYKKLWCDIAGGPILKNRALIAEQESYLLIVGPEGDFTPEEKILLNPPFTPVKLTNTVLRARDAASLLMGIVRV